MEPDERRGPPPVVASGILTGGLRGDLTATATLGPVPPPPPSAWERAVPWLMRLGWTLKLALNSGTALLGWRSRRYGAAS